MAPHVACARARDERRVGGEELQLLLDRAASFGARYLMDGLRQRVVSALRERDGDECCFGDWCLIGRPLNFQGWLPTDETVTIEHRVPWHICRQHRLDNMALAHRLCNTTDGNRRHRYRVRQERMERTYGHPHGSRPWLTAWPALTYAHELE